jgi:hypothetical protein
MERRAEELERELIRSASSREARARAEILPLRSVLHFRWEEDSSS